MRFNENPFTYQCKKEDKKAEGFQISHFYWSFSSDIMAVKGLNKSYHHTPWYYIGVLERRPIVRLKVRDIVV